MYANQVYGIADISHETGISERKNAVVFSLRESPERTAVFVLKIINRKIRINYKISINFWKIQSDI